MFRLKMLNVFEFLGLERVNPKQDSSFKVLNQSFFKSLKFYLISCIKLLDANPEFYVFSFISCDIPLATRLFSAIEYFKFV